MNPKSASLCIELVRKIAEHFNSLLRYTPYKDLFFVSSDYLCTGQELGRGKFATVYEGRHTVTGQRLAIKVMDKQKLIAEDPRVEEFLQRETSIMKSLDHPSVVRLHDVLETPTSLYLVMEFCPGGTLADYLTTKKILSEEEVQRYVRQIASGLQYMRARSVSHRDLKPANLLLVETGAGRICKITDFTFARFLNPGEISKTLVGSPLYMAPEIFNNYQYDGMVCRAISAFSSSHY
jgi:serine/threonine protein kinase